MDFVMKQALGGKYSNCISKHTGAEGDFLCKEIYQLRTSYPCYTGGVIL